MLTLTTFQWRADPRDRLAGAIRVQLVDRGGYPALVQASAIDEKVSNFWGGRGVELFKYMKVYQE